MENTIERMFRGAPKDYSQAGMEKCYSDWLEHVKTTVPKDRLLVHNAKEGWKPICDFLGKPVPDCPYPRVNDTAGRNIFLSKDAQIFQNSSEKC